VSKKTAEWTFTIRGEGCDSDGDCNDWFANLYSDEELIFKDLWLDPGDQDDLQAIVDKLNEPDTNDQLHTLMDAVEPILDHRSIISGQGECCCGVPVSIVRNIVKVYEAIKEQSND